MEKYDCSDRRTYISSPCEIHPTQVVHPQHNSIQPYSTQQKTYLSGKLSERHSRKLAATLLHTCAPVRHASPQFSISNQSISVSLPRTVTRVIQKRKLLRAISVDLRKADRTHCLLRAPAPCIYIYMVIRRIRGSARREVVKEKKTAGCVRAVMPGWGEIKGQFGSRVREKVAVQCGYKWGSLGAAGSVRTREIPLGVT